MGKYHVLAVLTMMLSPLYYPVPLIIIIVTCSCSVKENFMEACHEFGSALLTLVPKLKYEHVYLNYFSKMRVDLAVQVIN